MDAYFFRMGGIYGPDEKTILGRAFYFMSQSVGYFAFCQKKDLKIDWLHIDNAVQGHVKVKFKVHIYRFFLEIFKSLKAQRAQRLLVPTFLNSAQPVFRPIWRTCKYYHMIILLTKPQFW